MSLRVRIRAALAAFFARPGMAARGVRWAKPILRGLSHRPSFARAWRLVELTINQSGVRLPARTWFGAQMDCDLAEMIDKRILYTGVWEPDITQLFARHVAPGDVVVDVGANIGYFSLLAASLAGPTGRVVAIEAWPDTVRRLQRNIDANGLSNVTIKPVAVGETSGTLTLYDGGAGNVGMTSVHVQAGSSRTVPVPCERLATVLADIDLAAVHLIKIDIEGAEAPVLRDLRDMVGRLPARCAIIAEIWPRAFADAQTVIADFLAAGFAAWRIDNDYVFDHRWWRFDPHAAPRVHPLGDSIGEDRFDLLLLRDKVGTS